MAPLIKGTIKSCRCPWNESHR